MQMNKRGGRWWGRREWERRQGIAINDVTNPHIPFPSQHALSIHSFPSPFLFSLYSYLSLPLHFAPPAVNGKEWKDTDRKLCVKRPGSIWKGDYGKEEKRRKMNENTNRKGKASKSHFLPMDEPGGWVRQAINCLFLYLLICVSYILDFTFILFIFIIYLG